VSKKLEHKGDCPILVGQPPKLSVKTNLKQTCKLRRILAYKKVRIFQTYEGKNYS
jgi:hypothetical protein